MRRVLTLILSLFASLSAYAQANDIVTSYGVDDGLPQSSVWSIVQDDNGFLWLGTSDGVCRFDGYKFTSYNGPTVDSNLFSGSIYAKIYKDSSGRLWVVTQNSIGWYDAVQDKFKPAFYHQTTYHSSYNCILGEDTKYLWAAVYNFGILSIDKTTFNVTAYGNDSIGKIRSSLNAVKCGSEIWITSARPGGMYIYNTDKNSLEILPTPMITYVTRLNDTELVGAGNKNIVLFNIKSHASRLIPLTFFDDSAGSYITCIFRYSQNELMFAGPRGIFYIDPATWTITRHVTSLRQAEPNMFTYVQCIYRDRSNNLWIGTNGDGLMKLRAPYKKFRLYTSAHSKSNLVKSIYCTQQQLYVGYFANGMDIFDRKSGTLKNSLTYAHPLTQGSVLAITQTDADNILVQTGGPSPFAVSHNGSPAEDITAPFHKAVGNHDIRTPYAFFLSFGDSIYTNVGFQNIVSFSRTMQNGIHPKIRYHMDSPAIICGYKSSNGTLWLGTGYGAWYSSGGRLNKLEQMETMYVKTINEDTKGNIWIGTIKGIYVVDRNKHIVNHYTDRNGLTNQFIYGILPDNNGDMWFSHNKGLSVFHMASQTFRHYSKEDGLQSNEFNTGAYFKAADGELFFGGINGVNSFYPADIKDNQNAPTALITGIKIFDLPFASDTAYWNIHSLSLPYTQNTISFEFVAPELTDPSRNQYAYKMEGIDKDWISSGDRRFARYAAMPPGTYFFLVKAANNDGLWQNKPTRLTIYIVPPYWQRWWFRLLVAVTITGSTIAIILWLQRMKHRRQIRALELQQKVQQERERISRDLHDTVGTQLSLISNNVEWLAHPLREMNDDEKANKLSFVNDTAKEVITTFRETIWALNNQQITYEEFSDKLKGYVRKQLTSYPDIRLHYTDPGDKGIIFGPSEALNLFRICQEAVANSLKYAGATFISIVLESAGEKIHVSIRDNGCGFDPSSVDPEMHNGLENMKYRAADIGATLDIRSSPGNGTSISVTKK